MLAATTSDDIAVKPRASSSPVSVTTSTTAPTSNEPVTAVTPAGNSDVPRKTKASRAPASTAMEPSTSAAKAIHNFRADS